MEQDVHVIFCVGENYIERDAMKTNEVTTGQLEQLKEWIYPQDWKKLVIAYEPIWATGTDKCKPEHAEKAIVNIRDWVKSQVNPDIGDSLRIIYGGHVNKENAKGYMDCPNIDGFLLDEVCITD